MIRRAMVMLAVLACASLLLASSSSGQAVPRLEFKDDVDTVVPGRVVVSDGTLTDDGTVGGVRQVTITTGGAGGVPICTSATIGVSCGTNAVGELASVTDHSSGADCTTGGGATAVLCMYTGASWLQVDTAGSGLANVVEDTTPQLGGDLDAQTYVLSRGTQTISAVDGTHDDPTQFDGIIRTTVPMGPVKVCTTGSSSWAQNACVVNADCGGGGVCSFNPSMDSVDIVLDATSGTSGSVPGEWLAYDALTKRCYNAGDACNNAAPANSNTYSSVLQWEHDYRTGVGEGADRRLQEYFFQLVEPGTGTDGLRPWFSGVNTYPGEGSLNFGMASVFAFKQSFMRGETGAGVHEIGAGNFGTFDNDVKPGLTVGPKLVTAPSAFLDVSGASGFGGSQAGLSNDTLVRDAWNTALVSKLAVNHTASSYRGARYLTDVLHNPFGSCNAAGDAAEGARCLTHHDCNNGDPYDVSTDPGECAMGDGLTSSAIPDGVCTNTAARTVSGQCDNVGSTCAGAGTLCVDTQLWYSVDIPEIVTQDVQWRYADGDEIDIDSEIAFGYCAETGGGSANSQGIPCLNGGQCLSGTCVKDVDAGGRYIGAGIAQRITLDVSGDAPTSPTNADNFGGAFGIGNRSVNNLTGQEFLFNWAGTGKTLSAARMQLFAAPTISGTGQVLGNTNDSGTIVMQNQWANSLWRVPYIRIQNSSTGISNANVIDMQQFGHDEGPLKLGALYLHNGGEGTTPQTNHHLRIGTSQPGSSGAGEPVLMGIATSGVTHVLSGDASILTNDDGDEVCQAANLDCVAAGAAVSSATAGGCTAAQTGRYVALCN